MIEWFIELGPVSQALLAGLFTWGVTALGATAVIFFKTINKKILNGMLGFAAGVMIAASFWSLLAPAIEMSGGGWLPPLVGFLLGVFMLSIMDKVIPHLHRGFPDATAEGPKTSWHRSILLVAAITLHNIPEGLAVGVAFGAAYAGLESATLAGAIALAVGIGIQNFPEGLAVSMPLRRQGVGKFKSFWYGQLSAAVEPVAAVVGALAVSFFTPLLPYALAFAAGAMMFVVVEEVVPETQRDNHTDIATLGFIGGFIVMMTLDVGLG